MDTSASASNAFERLLATSLTSIESNRELPSASLYTAIQPATMECIVGTFNAPTLYTLRFQPENERLTIKAVHNAAGPHSWLSLSPDKTTMYCTVWAEPSSAIAAYRIEPAGKGMTFLNKKDVRGRPGYVCCSADRIYAVGGSTGQVFTVGEGGTIGEPIQSLNFEETGTPAETSNSGDVPHGDFGGLRHGAHSCDLSPDGKHLYVADIGRNAVWVYGVSTTTDTLETGAKSEPDLTLHLKSVAPRSNDGPRHAWPHPNGQIVYSLQEHSNMVDAFRLERDAAGVVTRLKHCGAVSVLPPGEECAQFWADEVRLSTGPQGSNPRYLFASTRGLCRQVRGYVSVFALDEDGNFKDETPIDMWMTPTSGGIANAIEPAPFQNSGTASGDHFLSLTDSEAGLVMILRFDGKQIKEVSRVELPWQQRAANGAVPDTAHTRRDGEVVQAATAVWL